MRIPGTRTRERRPPSRTADRKPANKYVPPTSTGWRQSTSRERQTHASACPSGALSKTSVKLAFKLCTDARIHCPAMRWNRVKLPSDNEPGCSAEWMLGPGFLASPTLTPLRGCISPRLAEF